MLKKGIQENLYALIWEIKNGVTKPQEDIKLLTMTWNMARKYQQPDFAALLPNVQIYDLVVLTFQEIKQRQQFVHRLDGFMESQNFKKMNETHMWEMLIVAYSQKQKIKLINGKVTTNTKACGVGKMFGNKGGIQIYFTYNDMHFNFTGCHLLHGQDNRIKRDEMMEEITKALKTERQEMDADVIYDYAFIMGDLNYRFDSTYEDMISTQQINIAHQLIDQYDQLGKSRKGGQMSMLLPNGQTVFQNLSQKYPGYQEAKIDFKPTYKRNFDDNNYKNKKSQAPSYCDRILFKNNTPYDYVVNFYTCNDFIYGSDHRPVYLSLTLKKGLPMDKKKVEEVVDVLEKFQKQDVSINDKIVSNLRYILNYKFQNKYMKLNINQAKQEYGIFKFKFIRISSIRLPQTAQANLNSQLRKLQANTKSSSVEGILQHFQVSLYANHINDFASSSEISHKCKH